MTQQLILPNGDLAPANGAAEKQISAEALRLSVIDSPQATGATPAVPIVEPLLLMIGDYADEIAPWGRMANDKVREKAASGAYSSLEPCHLGNAPGGLGDVAVKLIRVIQLAVTDVAIKI